MNEKELISGCAFDRYLGAPYHFEHILKVEADAKAETADQVHVIETINWTYASGKKNKEVHRNRYFAENLEEAIGLAAYMIISFQEVAETIVAIRPATGIESELHFKMMGSIVRMDPVVFPD